MTKENAKKLRKEFEKAHFDFSLKNGGYWHPNWKRQLKYADRKYGYWYWKGYLVASL